MKQGADTALDFQRALRKGFWRSLISFLSGRSNRLLPWEQVRDKLGLRGQTYRGIQAVPVDQIVGSVGRFQDFDRAFLPKQKNLEARWRSIAGAYYERANLPPVQLYKVGETYFVLDGNHRVSVARENGAKFIDAQVTEVESRVPIAAHLDADQLEIKGEYVRFLEWTRLDQLRPDQRIEFTIGGGYERMLEHIAAHLYFMGLERRQPVSREEAVCDWYDNLYIPLAQIVRERNILNEFPRRTEADLYLWIMEHQHDLREECGPEVNAEQAAEHFAERYTTRLGKRMLSAVQEMFRSTCESLAEGRQTNDLQAG